MHTAQYKKKTSVILFLVTVVTFFGHFINCKSKDKKGSTPINLQLQKKKTKFVILWNIFLDPNSPHVSGNYRQWYKHFDLVLEAVNSMLASEHYNKNFKLPRQVTRSPVELLFTCLNVV